MPSTNFIAGLTLGLLLAGPSLLQGAEEKVSFNRDIRPILSDNCFACHGPDEKKRDSGLRLDLREEALKEREGIRAIVPGRPEESDLFTRIASSDRTEVMPPPKTHKKLTKVQVETVKRWIVEGAEYQGHWAFITPVRPAVPPLAGLASLASGVQNPVDQFVRSRLALEKLEPNPEAPRETLIRRATLDLTGLPPTPAEVEAFLADRAPNAYEKVVDRLLASPRYGERMALEWLDCARYADSNGFQSDTSRQMWHWRDWVIEAFNRNLPFDRFTLEQLAGDLLPQPEREQIVATGFNRNHRLNGEGGRIVEEWFAETVIDRVETTGSTWLALTFNCCRCHDHKFDPITQKEFYQMFAFFNSNDETGVMDEFGGSGPKRGGGNSKPILALPSLEEEQEQAKLEAAAKKAEQRAAEAQKELPRLQAEWEARVVGQAAEQASAWQPLGAKVATSEGGAELKLQPDGSWLVSGNNASTDIYTITANLAPGVFTGLRIEALPSDSTPAKGIGRTSNGNFVLTGVDVEITAPSLPQQIRVDFTKAEADYEQKGFEARNLVEPNAGKAKDAKGPKGWAIDESGKGRPVERSVMLLASSPVEIPADASLVVRLRQESSFERHNLGRFRLSTTAQPPAQVKLQPGMPEPVRAGLAVEKGQRSAAQRDSIAKYFREKVRNPATQATTEAEQARREFTEFTKGLSSTMVMRELPQPRDAFILKRGEYDKRGDKVERGVPGALPPLPVGAPANRLGLAQWIVAPENPLTARVWVNRAWEKFFGVGLVRTSENFGSQAEWPSHPDLLDWLATEFVRLKWDMKEMQKTMVMSATYRQSSRVTPALVERDPENRLLARGPRFRLPAEMVRDQALAFSGLLVEKQGGPSVRPYMPERVWDETSVYGDMREYKADVGEGLYRRSLYTIWKRTASPPFMALFDSPTREICTVKRSRTNTPLQALSLLNEVTFVEAARVLAQQMIAQGGGSPEERVAWAFWKVTCRQPTPEEVQVLTTGLAKRMARYQEQPEAAEKLVKVGAAPAAEKGSVPELAAYAVTANILLNLDEVVTRE